MDDRHVGTLAETANRRIAFAYAESWLENGYSVSPFSLPLKKKVFVPVRFSRLSYSPQRSDYYGCHSTVLSFRPPEHTRKWFCCRMLPDQ